MAFWAHVGGFVAGALLISVFKDPRAGAQAPRAGPLCLTGGPAALARPPHAGAHGLGRFIDHTLLKPEATPRPDRSPVRRSTAATESRPCASTAPGREVCATRLAGSDVAVAVVAGFSARCHGHGGQGRGDQAGRRRPGPRDRHGPRRWARPRPATGARSRRTSAGGRGCRTSRGQGHPGDRALEPARSWRPAKRRSRAGRAS